MTGALYTVEDVAGRLHKSPRWLRAWLMANPVDLSGEPFYIAIGRDKMFEDDDVKRLKLGISEWERQKFENPPQRDSFVYFIDGGDVVKIGFTRSVETRIKKMLTDAPVALKLLHIEPGTFKTEKIYHRQFVLDRIRGEWFKKTPELLALIERRKAILEEEK